MSSSQIAGGARAASAITRAATAPMPACRGARRRPAVRRSPAVTATPPGRGGIPAAGRPRAATPPPIMDPPVSGRIERRPLVESAVRFSQIQLRWHHPPSSPINAPVRRMTAAHDHKGSSHPPARACTCGRLLARHRHAPGGILRAYAMAGAPPLPGGMRSRSQLCHPARRHGVLRAGAAERPARMPPPPAPSRSRPRTRQSMPFCAPFAPHDRVLMPSTRSHRRPPPTGRPPSLRRRRRRPKNGRPACAFRGRRACTQPLCRSN